MSRAVLLLALPLVFACTKKDEAPAADTSAPVAVEPAAPAAPAVAGKWAVDVMPMDKDTVLATFVLDATADQTGWKLTFRGREAQDVRVISMSNDSIVTEFGPYSSAITKGAKVNLVHSVFTLSGDKFTGTAIAHYDRKTADSVVTLRQSGTRQ